MKNVIYLILVMLIISCSNESNDIGKLSTLSQHLKIDEVKDYLPNSYFEEVAIVYKNNIGEELTLNVSSNESITEATFEDIKYRSDHFEVTLYDPENTSFQIVLTGSANHTSAGVSVFLGGILMPFNDSGTTWSTVRFNNGEPIIVLGDDFNETIVLNDREFKDVYVAIGKQGFEQFEAYSELDINSKEGVVAFRDDMNELWVYDRIEK